MLPLPDPKSLLDIFPLLVWYQIIVCLDDPLDKWNVISGEAVLEQLFQHQIAEWQFASVLPCLIKHFELRAVAGLKDAIFQSRLVSSECSKAVDKYIKQLWTRSCLGSHLPENIPNNINLDSSHAVSAFISKLKDYPVRLRTPVLRRDLSLTFHGVDWHSRSVQILSLLEIVGRHLFRVEIIIRNYDFPVPWNSYLRMALTFLPNLRSLVIRVQDDPRLPANTTFPLPRLPHLRNLAVICATPGLSTFLPVDSYFSNLTSLLIQFHSWKNEYNNGKITLENLKMLMLLNVKIHDEEDNTKLVQLFRMLDAPKIISFTFTDTSLNSDFASDEAKQAICLLENTGKECLSKITLEVENKGRDHWEVLTLICNRGADGNSLLIVFSLMPKCKRGL